MAKDKCICESPDQVCSSKKCKYLKASYPNGYVVFDRTPKTIQGKVLTIIETLNLTEKQEDSVKSLINSAIWDTFDREGIYISRKRHTDIRDVYEKAKRTAKDETLTLGAI